MNNWHKSNVIHVLYNWCFGKLFTYKRRVRELKLSCQNISKSSPKSLSKTQNVDDKWDYCFFFFSGKLLSFPSFIDCFWIAFFLKDFKNLNNFYHPSIAISSSPHICSCTKLTSKRKQGGRGRSPGRKATVLMLKKKKNQQTKNKNPTPKVGRSFYLKSWEIAWNELGVPCPQGVFPFSGSHTSQLQKYESEK